MRTFFVSAPETNVVERKEGACWLCDGEKRVEWWGEIGKDENGEPIYGYGVYDPCPQCEDKSEGEVSE